MNKDEKKPQMSPSLELPEISPEKKKTADQGQEESKEEEKSKEEKRLKEEEKPKYLPPIHLTKSQKRLYRSKDQEGRAAVLQATNAITMITESNKSLLIETFADELGINLDERKYGFDRDNLSFIDLNELRARQGMPRSMIPGSRRIN